MSVEAACDKAIRWLATRERSRKELVDRLMREGVSAVDAQAAVNALAADGLQSDERFTEVFVRSRHARGQGPFRIRVELEQKHDIDAALIHEHVAGPAFDWYEAAWEVAQRRYVGRADDQRERARRMRFMSTRGFERDHIENAFERLEQDDEEQ